MTLSKTTRVSLGIATLLLIITYFVPLWQILLWAPQYPEGLTMKIWMNKLSGEVDIINGLNHYIGMKHISVEMFPEFQYLGFLIGFLMLVGLLASILGSPRILFAFTLLSYIYGIAALWDFWRWGYEYGHNLSPDAPIKVPDMSYQPPVVGYKNLLNFTSYSGPDTGAWIIIGVCLLATALWWWEFFKARKKTGLKLGKGIGIATGIFVFLNLNACSTGPEPINFGQDSCHACKMTLTDRRFGAEIITDKGKVFKFDDLNCLVGYLKSGEIPAQNVATILAVDFSKAGAFVAVKQGFFLQNDAIKSPMRADIGTFSSKEAMEKVKNTLGGGKELSWAELQNEF